MPEMDASDTCHHLRRCMALSRCSAAHLANLAVLFVQVLHPAEALLQSVQLQTPSLPRHAMRGLPEMVRMKAAPLIIGPKGSRRVELELRVPVPGAFGAMNISGPVSDWSYPPEAFKVSPGFYVEQQFTRDSITNLFFCSWAPLRKPPR